MLPCGDEAILVELDDLDHVLALVDAIETPPTSPHIRDVVPAARTVLVRLDAPTSADTVARYLRSLRPTIRSDQARAVVEVPIRYDGPDLDDIAMMTGLTVREVISAHADQLWVSAFVGFAPGFSYLVGTAERIDIPRRNTPRVRVPPGAVGLAGEFSGIYPRASPGGWQLIGTTDAVLWDLNRPQPSLLFPGCAVQFVRTR